MKTTTYKIGPIKVYIGDGEYWFQQEEDGGGPVSPLNHCDENGQLLFSAMFGSETFAHVYPNRQVFRYREKIGQIDDFLTPPSEESNQTEK